MAKRGRKLIDLKGRKVGQWTVLKYAGGVQHLWRCRCSCGTIRNVAGGALRGSSHNDRCRRCFLKLGKARRHGETKTRLYNIHRCMLQRCGNRNNPSYPRYGGRGIRVCKAWKTFVVFRAWARANGYRAKLTIDRIKNGRGYSPKNCRWATASEQRRNQRGR